MGKIIQRIRTREQAIIDQRVAEMRAQWDIQYTPQRLCNPLMSHFLNTRVSDSLPVIEKKFGRPSVFRWFGGNSKTDKVPQEQRWIKN